MTSIGLLGFVAAVVLTALAIRALVHKSSPSRILAPPEVRALLAASRQRAVIATSVATAVFVGLGLVGTTALYLHGLPAALAPSVAALTGLLTYALAPSRALAVDPSAQREAPLDHRTPLRFIGRLAWRALVILASTQVVFLLAAGLFSSPDASGRYSAITMEKIAASCSCTPFPGWFYGTPLLISTAALVAATWIALWRVSTVASVPQAEWASLDFAWRQGTSRILVAIACTALLVQFGGVAFMAGGAMRGLGMNCGELGLSLGGNIISALGVAMLVSSIVSFTFVLVWSFQLPDIARQIAASARTRHTEDS